MKRILFPILMLLAVLAQAQTQPIANALRLDHRNATNTAYVSKFVPPAASGLCMITMQGADTGATPSCLKLGDAFEAAGGKIDVPLTWAAIDGKPAAFSPVPHAHAWADITAKPAFAAVATTGAYADLTGKPAIPTVPTINRARVVTDSEGAYTWALPTACDSPPVVTVTPEALPGLSLTGPKITALSTSSVSIAATAGAAVHLIAICP